LGKNKQNFSPHKTLENMETPTISTIAAEEIQVSLNPINAESKNLVEKSKKLHPRDETVEKTIQKKCLKIIAPEDISNEQIHQKYCPPESKVHTIEPSNPTDEIQDSLINDCLDSAEAKIERHTFITNMKSAVKTLVEKHSDQVVQRKVRRLRDNAMSGLRVNIIKTFFRFREIGELDATRWSMILSENFEMELPITTYRSFPASQVKGPLRQLKGIFDTIEDTSSLHAIFRGRLRGREAEGGNANSRKRKNRGDWRMEWEIAEPELVIQEDVAAGSWICKLEFIKADRSVDAFNVNGMFFARFSELNRLLSLRLSFDTHALSSFLQRCFQIAMQFELNTIPDFMRAPTPMLFLEDDQKVPDPGIQTPAQVTTDEDWMSGQTEIEGTDFEDECREGDRDNANSESDTLLQIQNTNEAELSAELQQSEPLVIREASLSRLDPLSEVICCISANQPAAVVVPMGENETDEEPRKYLRVYPLQSGTSHQNENSMRAVFYGAIQEIAAGTEQKVKLFPADPTSASTSGVEENGTSSSTNQVGHDSVSSEDIDPNESPEEDSHSSSDVGSDDPFPGSDRVKGGESRCINPGDTSDPLQDAASEAGSDHSNTTMQLEQDGHTHDSISEGCADKDSYASQHGDDLHRKLHTRPDDSNDGSADSNDGFDQEYITQHQDGLHSGLHNCSVESNVYNDGSGDSNDGSADSNDGSEQDFSTQHQDGLHNRSGNESSGDDGSGDSNDGSEQDYTSLHHDLHIGLHNRSGESNDGSGDSNDGFDCSGDSNDGSGDNNDGSGDSNDGSESNDGSADNNDGACG